MHFGKITSLISFGVLLFSSIAVDGSVVQLDPTNTEEIAAIFSGYRRLTQLPGMVDHTVGLIRPKTLTGKGTFSVFVKERFFREKFAHSLDGAGVVSHISGAAPVGVFLHFFSHIVRTSAKEEKHLVLFEDAEGNLKILFDLQDAHPIIEALETVSRSMEVTMPASASPLQFFGLRVISAEHPMNAADRYAQSVFTSDFLFLPSAQATAPKDVVAFTEDALYEKWIEMGIVRRTRRQKIYKAFAQSRCGRIIMGARLFEPYQIDWTKAESK